MKYNWIGILILTSSSFKKHNFITVTTDYYFFQQTNVLFVNKIIDITLKKIILTNNVVMDLYIYMHSPITASCGYHYKL